MMIGKNWRLRPIDTVQAAAGLAAMLSRRPDALDESVFRWTPITNRTVEELRSAVFFTAERGPAWAVETLTGEPAGMIGVHELDLEPYSRSGWVGTWLLPGYFRCGANTEAKLLLLHHAFEELGLVRLGFRVDTLNDRSNAAMARIGARLSGTTRKQAMVKGRWRDTNDWEILDDDWPAIKIALEDRVYRPDR